MWFYSKPPSEFFVEQAVVRIQDDLLGFFPHWNFEVLFFFRYPELMDL